MATTTKKKSATSKGTKNLLAKKAKFNRLQVLSVIVILVAVGVAVVLFAHASSPYGTLLLTWQDEATNVQHTQDTTPIYHSGGNPVTVNGIGYWQSNSAYNINHFASYGPYTELKTVNGNSTYTVVFTLRGVGSYTTAYETDVFSGNPAGNGKNPAVELSHAYGDTTPGVISTSALAFNLGYQNPQNCGVPGINYVTGSAYPACDIHNLEFRVRAISTNGTLQIDKIDLYR